MSASNRLVQMGRRTRRGVFVVATVFVWLSLAISGAGTQNGLAEWTAFTSMRGINKVNSDSTGEVWAATDGGALHYSPQTGEYQRFTRLDGLGGNRLLSVTRDDTGDLWFGTDGEGLSRYHTSEGHFDSPFLEFRDLRITALTSSENRLYVGTDEGVTLFSIDREEVKETYRQLGELPRNADVTAIALHKDSLLFVSTESGASWAPVDGANLQDPDSWDSWHYPPGITDVLSDGTSVFMATLLGIFSHTPGIERRIVIEMMDQPVLSLGVIGGRVVGHTPGGDFIRRLETLNWQRMAAPSIVGVRDLSDNDESLWIATSDGLRVIGAPSPTPSSEPAANRFFEIAIADDGVWVASAPDDLQESFGVYQLADVEESEWVVHNGETGMPNNDLVSLEVDAVGRAWVGSWGGGLSIRLGRSWRHLNDRNSPLIGIGSRGDFVAVSDISRDEEGNMWIVSVLGAVHVFDGYPVSRSFAFTREWLGFEKDIHKVAPARNGLKWVTSRVEGLLLLDDGSTPFEGDDDYKVRIDRGSEPRLSSNRVLDVLAADDGTVWVATDNGLNSFQFTYDAYADSLTINSWQVYTTIDGLPSSEINDLETTHGHLWVATEQGLARLNDGEVDLTITKGNSGLIDNRVKSLRHDPSTKQLWIGTMAGLSRLQLTTSADAGENREQGGSPVGFAAYPNPFVPDRGVLTVAGVASGSTLGVFQADGHLVAHLVSYESPAIWDGRNASGEIVASGVYILVGEDVRGNQFLRKIAVVRIR